MKNPVVSTVLDRKGRQKRERWEVLALFQRNPVVLVLQPLREKTDTVSGGRTKEDFEEKSVECRRTEGLTIQCQNCVTQVFRLFLVKN